MFDLMTTDFARVRNMCVALGVAAAFLVGCAHDVGTEQGSDKTTAQAGDAKTTAAAAQLGVVAVSHAKLEVPADWTQKTHGAWTLITGADSASLIAMGPVAENDGIPAKVVEGAAALGATEVKLLEEQTASFGAEQLPARVADGGCKLGLADGRLGYAVVDLGKGERVMVIHAALKDASPDKLRAGRMVVASLKRL
jgi:hypothetical protein